MLTYPIPIDRELVLRIQMEFVEMPGLRLTAPQARRLWHIEEAACARILALLVEQCFLTRTVDGSYQRTGRRHLSGADAA